VTTLLALVRGINVGGYNRVAMSDLRRLAEQLGGEDVRSLLQTGNLVFRADARDTLALEQRLERAAVKGLGLKQPAFFVRTAAEWAELVKRNPFPAEALRDPGHLLSVLHKQAPRPAALSALRAAIPGREQVAAHGRTAYFYYPDGVGRSKLTPALIEKHLPGRGTARNWNTVLKLLELARG
jgi:uncharacterized protein (DUF1697 family)